MKLYKHLYPWVLFYSNTAIYLAGVAVAMLIAAGWISLGTGLLTLTSVLILVMMAGIYHEVRAVHGLCDGHTKDLHDHIDLLTSLLHEAGIDPPDHRPQKKDGLR